ncbi:MAG: DUF4340 domain-containing protein [Deltaproteobacteria bacterium]|nr:DUF4340 domain-containing protein [Deltaproteobacteria bacterium]
MNLVGENRRVFILGLLACVLGGYTYVTMPLKNTVMTKTEATSDRPIFAFHAEKIAQFDVTYNGKQVNGKRTSEGWKSSDGTLLPSSVIDDFLVNLTKLVNLGEVERGENDQLSNYGLEPPVSQIVLDVENTGPQRLLIGKHNPVNTSLYALINQSSQVVMVGSIVSWEMRKLVDAIQSAASAG